MDSLFAKRIFLLKLIKDNVGSSPAIPGIAETVMSIVLIYFSIFLRLFKMIICLNLFFFLP